MSTLSLTVLTVVDVTIRQLCLIVCVGLAGDITSWLELNWVIMPPTV